MEPADDPSSVTREELPPELPADHCEVCGEEIGWTGITLMAWHASEAVDAWGFCQECYQLLRETIRVEVHYGPKTPPPEAWTRVRKLRAARVRRWGKVDR